MHRQCNFMSLYFFPPCHFVLGTRKGQLDCFFLCLPACVCFTRGQVSGRITPLSYRLAQLYSKCISCPCLTSGSKPVLQQSSQLNDFWQLIGSKFVAYEEVDNR